MRFVRGMKRHFTSYDEFFLHYLRQHRSSRNRLLHACGTALGIVIVIASLALGRPWFAFLFVPVGYGFAWFGHLLIERNHPATWGHPWWSFLSDFRMLGLMLTGDLDQWIAKAEASEKLLANRQVATGD